MKGTLKSVLIIALAVSCIIFMGSVMPAHAETSTASSSSGTSNSSASSTASSFKILFQNSELEDGEAEEIISGRTFAVFSNYNEDADDTYEDEDDDDYDSCEDEDDDSYEDEDESEETYELDWYDDDENTDGIVISENCTSPVIITDGNTVYFTERRNDQECLTKYSCSSDKTEVIKAVDEEDYISLDTIRGNILFISSSSKPMSVYGLDLQTSELFKITGGVAESFSGQYFLCAKCTVPCDDFFGSWYIYKMDGQKCVTVKKLSSCSNIARMQGGRIYYVSYSTSGKNQVMKIYSIKTDGSGKTRIKTFKAKNIYAVDINKKHCWYVNGNKTYRFDFSSKKSHIVSNTVMP